jgi:hypothetical protein
MSSLGLLRLRSAQAERLGLAAYQRFSPMLEKCCLRLSANESYQKAESEIEALMGVKVNHSTFQRLVQRTEVELPIARQKVTQVSVDGGKVRVRTPVKGQKCDWFEYKSARVEGMYYGATFQANLELTDWLNTQPLCSLMACLGDGHDGVWKLFEAVATASERLEILDWYHLKENLYKIGGSLKRLKQAESWLWQGGSMRPRRFSKTVDSTKRVNSATILNVIATGSLTMPISRQRAFRLALGQWSLRLNRLIAE